MSSAAQTRRCRNILSEQAGATTCQHTRAASWAVLLRAGPDCCVPMVYARFTVLATFVAFLVALQSIPHTRLWVSTCTNVPQVTSFQTSPDRAQRTDQAQSPNKHHPAPSAYEQD